jgi:hypothetical protein
MSPLYYHQPLRKREKGVVGVVERVERGDM